MIGFSGTQGKHISYVEFKISLFFLKIIFLDMKEGWKRVGLGLRAFELCTYINIR